MKEYKSLIYQWIKPLRKIKEFQEIAKVEDIEFQRLYGIAERALLNMFIEYADADGIAHLEKIVGIYPDSRDTLDARRARLYLYWNEKEPYTEEELKNRLLTLCGDLDGFDVITDYPNYKIEIVTRTGVFGLFDEITHMLDYLLPCNLLLNLHNEIEEESTTGVYSGGKTITAMSYSITNDIDATYPLSGGYYVGNPVATAMDSTVTNDIAGEVVSTANQYIGDIPDVAMVTETN